MNYSILALIPIVAGIGEAIRITGVPCKYVPFINLVVGLTLGIILCNMSDIGVCAVDGLYIGLGASGLTRSSHEVTCMVNKRCRHRR